MDNGFNENKFENSEANTGFSADSQEKTTNTTGYQYKYDPYTGERKVYYGYAGGPAGGSQPPKKPKRSKKGLWIALICIATTVAISFGSIMAYIGISNNIIDHSSTTKQEDPAQQPSGSGDQSGSDSSEPNVDLNLNTDSAALAELLGSDVSLTDIAQNTIKSVVCIQNYQNVSGGFQGYFNDNSGSSTQLYGEGSGVIITKDGYAITNQHVVDGCDALQVMMSTGEIYDAKLIGEDTVSDLALIKIEPDDDSVTFSPIVIGDSSKVDVASYALAVGNPGGTEFSSTVTLGIISATNRPVTISSGYTINMLQTDAAINPGNSGGALVNMQGELVGICSAKYVATGYENMGFAITINEAMPIIKELAQYGYVKSRGTIDIEYQAIDSSVAQYYGVPQGLYLTSVGSGCGDLSKGCIITEVNGTAVNSDATLSNALSGKTEGDTVSVKYYNMNTNKYGETQVTLVESKVTTQTTSDNDTQTGGSGDIYDYYQYYYGNGGNSFFGRR